MRRGLSAALAALLLAAAPVAASAGIGWRHAPIGLKVYANAGAEVEIAQAIADWNLSPYVELVPTGTSSSGTFRYNGATWPCGPKTGAIVICTSPAPYNFAYLTYKGRYLHSAFISLYVYTQQLIVCQEIGHALGLNHSHDDPDSCMNQSPAADHPSAGDYADLAAMYGP